MTTLAIALHQFIIGLAQVRATLAAQGGGAQRPPTRPAGKGNKGEDKRR
ncbi:MAG: hypothetical protein HC914_12045 [Chloroflexaceae bacterium]|nr:hypothetical protein [Chloroflexaceae bacterium]